MSKVFTARGRISIKASQLLGVNTREVDLFVIASSELAAKRDLEAAGAHIGSAVLRETPSAALYRLGGVRQGMAKGVYAVPKHTARSQHTLHLKPRGEMELLSRPSVSW